MLHKNTLLGAAFILLAGTFTISPLSAQSADETTATAPESVAPVDPFIELDQLAEAAVEEESGLLLAQEQAARGEFLEAMGTIERVLALHPKSQSARLLHAIYLCRIDDLPGGAVELDKLKKKNFPEELWLQAVTICKIGTGDAP